MEVRIKEEKEDRDRERERASALAKEQQNKNVALPVKNAMDLFGSVAVLQKECLVQLKTCVIGAINGTSPPLTVLNMMLCH
jgi:hypothetical protein